MKDAARLKLLLIMRWWKLIGEFGERIVEQEQEGKERAQYGGFLIRELSRHLGDNFGKGFSVANLKNMRMFYLTFRDNQKSYTLCSQLSWSHVRLIMRLNSEKSREYYLNEAKIQNWTVRVLEFLGLSESIEGKESHLESAIIAHLQDFLLEMGRGFSFVGRQFRISTETSHFFIDLVFYNYLLKCFVVIDLKTQKLTHQDIGQIDMYVRMFDDMKRGADDNPTIGIILCADKDETIVKYSVLQESRQLFASKYKTVLPTEAELAAELERNATMLRRGEKGGEADE